MSHLRSVLSCSLFSSWAFGPYFVQLRVNDLQTPADNRADSLIVAYAALFSPSFLALYIRASAAFIISSRLFGGFTKVMTPALSVTFHFEEIPSRNIEYTFSMAELVATKACHNIDVPDSAANRLRHCLQQFVPLMMTMTVVYVLEVVNIDKRKCEWFGESHSRKMFEQLLLG